MGIGIDTASHAEVEQCLEQGLPGDRIVCTAAVKDRALMTLCVGGGVTVILDNEDELELLEDVAEGATKPVSVGLRLNGFERDGTKLYSRFGFPLTSSSADASTALSASAPIEPSIRFGPRRRLCVM